MLVEQSIPPLPEGFTLQRITNEDYDKGALRVLEQLTVVGEVSKESFETYVSEQSDKHITITIKDPNGEIVGISTLLIETKLIHGFSKVGHVEDVAVDKSMRGSKIGLSMLKYLTNLAIENGCYKVILDCDEKNVGFYEKCRFSRAGVEMQYR